jgi:hypothetical protein
MDSIVFDLPKHSLEVVKLLSNRLRATTKIVRSIVDKHHGDDENGSSTSSKKKVVKVLCYDTTSWVKETFEPQVSFRHPISNNKTQKRL